MEQGNRHGVRNAIMHMPKRKMWKMRLDTTIQHMKWISLYINNSFINLMSLANLFHFLCAQHVSDINISIIRSLRQFCWITTLVVLFLVRCVLEFRCGCVGVVSVLQAASACNMDTTANVVIQRASACHTDTTPTQSHRNSNTHRNKNTQPMWWYNRKVAGSWWWMY